MGNCGSAPAVKDDPPVTKPIQDKSSTQPPPATAPSSATVASRDQNRPQGRKSASLEILPSARLDVAQSPSEEARQASEADGEEEENIEWKAKRRVSRRLSLEVKKKPGSKTGSPSPAYGTPPTAEEQAAWDVAADSDMVESKRAVRGGPSGSPSGSSGGNLADFLKGSSGGGDLVRKSVLGPSSASKPPIKADPSKNLPPALNEEEEEEASEVPVAWKVQRRGRRLSLEVKKAPDLALLAAVRRSSSTPLTGQYSRNNPGQQVRMETFTEVGATKSAAVVIDFAQKGRIAEDTQEEDDSGTVKAAKSILQAAKEGSPDPFRARRRRSRRLSLEIEKKPDDAVLAAVRRTHSAPITAAAARAAMGEAAWAEVAAGKGGEQGESPIFEPPPPTYSGSKEGEKEALEKEKQKPGWGSGQVIDFASEVKMAAEDAKRGVVEAEEAGKGYVRVNPRRTRRRSMDVYKKAISSGASEDSAVQLAKQYDPDFNAKEYSAEEADLLDEEEDDQVTDFSTAGGGKDSWKKAAEEEKAGPPGLAGISI